MPTEVDETLPLGARQPACEGWDRLRAWHGLVVGGVCFKKQREAPPPIAHLRRRSETALPQGAWSWGVEGAAT